MFLEEKLWVDVLYFLTTISSAKNMDNDTGEFKRNMEFSDSKENSFWSF